MKVKNEIENLIKELDKDIKDIEKKIESPNKDGKQKIFELLKENIQLLKNKHNGEEIEENKIRDNKTAIENLEELIKQRKNEDMNPNQERELFEEEQNKMDEWEKKKEEQNKILDEIGSNIHIIKDEAIKAGEAIDNIDKKVKGTTETTEKVIVKVESQNERLKDLVNKMRSSDKICCDIVLVLILLGLIMVLYSIIKHKYK